MKSNDELRELAWKRLWADKWFGRLFGAGFLLGICGYAVSSVLRSILGRLNVQDWQDYAQAVTMNRHDVTSPVPNLTSEYIWQATSSTCLEGFFSFIMAGITAYGCAVVLRKCLRNDGEGNWLAEAFGGFKWPFGLLWMQLRLTLTYLGWFLVGAIPLGAAAGFCYPRLSSGIAAGSVEALAAVMLFFMLAFLVLILLMCVPFYRYRFLFLVKAEQPELGANACYRTCRELMKGHLMTSFRLDVSYWRPITGVLLLCLALTGGALALTLVPTWVQLVLGALLFAGLLAILVCSIVLSQYIGVGQGFLYQEIKDKMPASSASGDVTCGESGGTGQ